MHHHPCWALRNLTSRGETPSDVSYPRPGRPQFILRWQSKICYVDPSDGHRPVIRSSRTSDSYPTDQQLPRDQAVRQLIRKGTFFISFLLPLLDVSLCFFSPEIHDRVVCIASHPIIFGTAVHCSVHLPSVRLTYIPRIGS